MKFNKPGSSEWKIQTEFLFFENKISNVDINIPIYPSPNFSIYIF